MATETATTQVIIFASGQSQKVPNFCYDTSSNLSVVYEVNGNPTSVTFSVEGISNANSSGGSNYGAQGGSATVLDQATTSGTGTTRSISLGGISYDSFRVSCVWNGGQNVSVTASLSASGSGYTWNAEQDLTAFQTY